MIKAVKGTIYYKMKADHPDLKYIDPMLEENIFSYNDTYIIKGQNDDYIKDYISSDLKLIAGGGYSAKYIYDVTITFERID